MSIRVDVYHHIDRSLTDEHYKQISHELHLILEEIANMSAELDRLTAAVNENTTVDESIITLVAGLAQQLRDLAAGATELADLKAGVTAMAADLEAANQKVADAVSANTPTPPTP